MLHQSQISDIADRRVIAYHGDGVMSTFCAEDTLFTVAEIAQALRMHKTQICEFFHAGKFPGAFQANGPGSAIRIPRNALDKFIRAGQPNGDEADAAVSAVVTAILRVRDGR